jgi:molybdate transport system substrate-binding protein
MSVRTLAAAVLALARATRLAAAAAIAAAACAASAAASTAPADAAATAGRDAGAPTLTVYAAASLTDALGEIAVAWTHAGGHPVRLSFAASSVLARQVEAGARADAFVSADATWMDYLERRGLLVPRTRANVAGNTLVLIAPADSRVSLAIGPGFPLRAALGRGRLALADPDTVPAGRYARAALATFGVWSEVATRTAVADDVRRALAFVARGEAPLGVVYETDARREPRVRIVDRFPASSHPPVEYPAAALRGGAPDGARFVEFLRGPVAAAIFARHGFTPAAVR